MKPTECVVVLPIDLKVYHLEAVKKAAYRFAARASILLKSPSDSFVEVIFNFKERTPEGETQAVLSDFRTELLDQELRFTISEETTPVRNLILAHAFSNSSLVPQSNIQ